MKNKYFRFYLSTSVFLLLIYILSSCNPSKRVQEGDYLLMKNNLDIVHMNKNDSLAPSKKELKLAIEKDDIINLMRQVPNRKFIGLIRIYLGFYNMINPEKMAADIVGKKEKLVLKNEKREEKGKENKKYKKTWREWIAEDLGELPVVFDSTLANVSIGQIENYLYNKGFFNPKVSYSISKDSLKNRAVVSYKVAPEIPYRINRIDFFIQNKDIEDILLSNIIKNDSLIHHGDRFDLNELQRYQVEVTKKIRNQGYYLFNSSMVYFQADTNLNKYMVNLSLFVNDTRLGRDNKKIKLNDYYRKYYIDNIYVNTSYPALKDENDDVIPYDTLDYRKKEILYQHRFRYNPKLFQRSLIFNKGSLFSVDDTEISFKKLFELGSFDLVNISYDLAAQKDSSKAELPLDAYINLNPAKNQTVSFEATATNNGGYLGIAGSVTYSHKNIFKGAEQLRISIAGGVEAQQAIDEDVSSSYFNTIEISPEIELIFPHFVVPFPFSKHNRVLNPKTSIAINYNFQDRPDYKRTTTTSYYGYKWNSNADLNHQLNIFQIAFTKINKSQQFQDYLDGLNNKVLESSYENNVVPSIKYIGTYNNQKSTFQGKVFYARFFLQEAGAISRLIAEAVDGEKNEQDQYLIGDIPFANFIKTEIDMRFYRNFNSENSIAGRIDIGSAWTLKNLDVMPFTDAFFVGGSNSNRAWRPRTLGPGSYTDTTGIIAYDKIGDIKIDLSFEYRFNLVSIVDLGLFIDASNIWYMAGKNGLTLDDPGVFNIHRFIGEIGIGGGIGLRLNFNFFLIRFDFGYRLKDPAPPVSERWFWQPKDIYNATNGSAPDYNQKLVIFNLAIGYPF